MTDLGVRGNVAATNFSSWSYPMQAIPFDQFETEYIAVLSGPRYAVATRKKMVQVLHQVHDLGVRSTAELTTVTVVRYAQVRIERVSANTVRGELTYLRAACNYARRRRYRRGRIDWRTAFPRRGPRARQVLHPPQHISRVLHYLERGIDVWTGHRLFAAASLAALTGVRRSELLYAHWSDFDLYHGVWAVVARHRLKTEGSERLVPLCAEAVTVARAWRAQTGCEFVVPRCDRQGPWVCGGIGHRLTDQLVAAGETCRVEGFTCQSLRHSFATWARRLWGLTGEQVSEILGHTMVTTHVENYLHARLELPELGDIARRIGYRA
jgi:integrase